LNKPWDIGRVRQMPRLKPLPPELGPLAEEVVRVVVSQTNPDRSFVPFGIIASRVRRNLKPSGLKANSALLVNAVASHHHHEAGVIAEDSVPG
jgi:hypothetical protein